VKKLLTLALVASFAACNSSNPPAAQTDSTKVAKDSTAVMRDINSPYPPAYSAKFAMDDAKNAETVLAFWKAFDSGDFSNAKGMFADTVDLHFADGTMIHAGRDSVLSMAKTFRGSLAAVVSTLNAVMAVKSTDKGDHWALVWGMEKPRGRGDFKE
jgi:hypothetical protein